MSKLLKGVFLFMGSSKYSNEFKAFCIDNGILDIVRNNDKRIYKMNDLSVLSQWLDMKSHNKELDCSSRLIESKYRKYARARKKIESLVLSGKAVFITLTFTNDVLNNTSSLTRRRYVARYLKEQCAFYLANIDYSPKKEREHYHAVVSDRVDMSKWSYGFVYCESVRAHDMCAKRVARYVAKLTSHAFKVDATRLIYSRSSV